MGNHSSKVIEEKVDAQTVIEIELIKEIMENEKEEDIKLNAKQATKVLELFCTKLQVKLKERIEISVQKILANSNIFTINEFINFTQTYLPKGKKQNLNFQEIYTYHFYRKNIKGTTI